MFQEINSLQKKMHRQNVHSQTKYQYSTIFIFQPKIASLTDLYLVEKPNTYFFASMNTRQKTRNMLTSVNVSVLRQDIQDNQTNGQRTVSGHSFSLQCRIHSQNNKKRFSDRRPLFLCSVDAAAALWQKIMTCLCCRFFNIAFKHL